MISEDCIEEILYTLDTYAVPNILNNNVRALIAEVRELRKALILESSNLTDALCQTAKHKERNEQLEKEVEWLADNAKDCPGISGASTFCWRHCPMWIGPRNRSGHCEKVDMREAARRAVNNE